MSNSWKQYGGTRKQEKFHNLTIGTLVADQVLLRESYAGKYIISGTINVGAEVEAIGNVMAGVNVNSTYDVYAGQNAYVKNKLYLGTTNVLQLSDTTHAYMYGDSAGNAFGINTTAPRSVFDIVANKTSQTNVLTVRSLTTTINNVLGVNVNNKGLALNAQENVTNLNFFVDNVNNGTNAPDAQIQQATGGVLTLSSNKNVINSIAGNTTILSSQATNISSGTLMNIISPLVTLTTSQTNILSSVGISNRGAPTVIFNETATIYDTSNGLYLFEAYENSSAYAGSAMTLTAKDASSNTFFRITAPNKVGASIGGGSFPNDQSRSLATIGLTDISGNYKINQTIVSGNNVTRYLSTTGINTYAPKTELYVMDINGAMRIGNGEINNIKTVDFEVLNGSFSKISASYGIVVGTASTSVFSIGKRVTVYPLFVAYTSNGGASWNTTRVDTSTDLETSNRTFNVFTYSSNYAIIGSSNNFFYFTLNGGANWYPFTFNDPIGNTRIRTTVSIYVGEYNGNVKRVFIVYTLPGSAQMYIVYFSLNFTTLPSTGNTYFIGSTSFTTITSSMSTIRANDGNGDFVYFVGSGINKYQVSTGVSQYIINTSYSYNSIACYSTTFAIAVGANVISYTTNGTTWSNITLSSTSIGNVTLRSVHIYSSTQAVAVGDGGIFLYTINGAVSWQVVPNSILNSAGTAARINGTSNKLRHVFMSDINSLTISSVKQQYSLTQVGTQFVQTPGQSKLYYCYLPNLFNRAGNNVLDVSGNSTMSGDLNINDGGNLITNNSTFNLINTNAQTVNFAGAASTVNIGNSLGTGTTNINNRLNVISTTQFQSDIYVKKNILVDGDLITTGSQQTSGDLSMNSRLYVGGDSVFSGNLDVRGLLIIDMNYVFTANLTVDKTAFFKQNLNVFQDTSMTGNLYVGGKYSIFDSDVSLNKRLWVAQDVSFQKNLDLAGNLLAARDISLNGNLRFKTGTTSMTMDATKINVFDGSRSYVDVSMSKMVYIKDLSENVQPRLTDLTSRTKYIKSDTSDNNTMMQMNKATNQILLYGNIVPAPGQKIALGSPDSFFDSLFVNTNTIYFSGGAQTAAMSFNASTGGLDISHNNITGSSVLSYEGNVAIGKPYPDVPLDVSGDVVIVGDISQQDGNLYSSGKLTVGSDANLGGNVLIGGYVIQSGQLLLNSNLTVGGTSKLSGPLSATGDVSFGNRLYVAGDLSANGNLYVAGASIQIGDLSLNSRLSVGSDLSVNGGLRVRNKATFQSDISANGNLTLLGGMSLRGDVSLNSRLLVGSDLSLGANIWIGGTTISEGDTNLKSRLFVSDITRLASDVFINGKTTANGDISLNKNILVGGDASFNGNLFVNGSSTLFNTDVSMNGNVVINGASVLNGNTIINGFASVTGDISLNNNVTIKSNAYIGRDLSLNRNIYIGRDASFNGNVTVNGRSTVFNRDVSFNGKTVFSDVMTNNNDVFMNNQLKVGGLFTTNDISMNGNLVMNGNLLTNSNVLIAGKTTMAGDVSFNSSITVNGASYLNGNTKVNANLYVASDTSLNGNLTVNALSRFNNDAIVNGDFYANNNSFLSKNLTVGGNTLLNQNVNIMQDLSVNGNFYVGNFGNSTIPISAIIGGYGLAVGAFANDVNVAKNFYVGGDTILYGNLTVVKNFNLIGMLTIQQYTVNQTITTVSYEIMIAEDLSLAGRLYMTGDASINGRLYIGDDVSLNSNLYVDNYSNFNKNVIMNDSLYVLGGFDLGGEMTLRGFTTFNKDVSMNGNLSVGGNQSIFVQDVSINNRLYVGNDVSLNSKLWVAGKTTYMSDVSMNNRLFINRDLSLNANLYVLKTSNFIDDVCMNSHLYVNDDASFSSNVYVLGKTTNMDDVSMNSRLFILKDVSLTSNIYVRGNTLLNGNVVFNRYLMVRNDISANANVYVTNFTTLNSDVSMNTRLYVNWDVSFNKDLYVKRRIIVDGDMSLNKRLLVQGDASFNTRLYVGDLATFRGDVSMNADLHAMDASFCGNVHVTGNIYVHNTLRFDSLLVKKTTNLVGDVYIQGSTQMVDTSMNGTLNVMNDISLDRNLLVGGDVSLNGDMLVIGKTKQLSDVSMISMLDLNGSMIARSNINVLGVINQYTTGTDEGTIVNTPAYITSSATKITLGASSRQTVTVPGDIYMNGNVGIGTTTPSCPLYVNNYAASSSQNSGYFLANSSSVLSALTPSIPYNYSIYATNSIATADKLIATTMVNFSDQRIKTNIEDVDSAESLDTLRKIKPKRFCYIDNILQGSLPTWGFIAQQVKTVLDYSVSLSKNYIPNIYELATVVDGNKLVFKNKSTSDISMNGIETKIKLFTIKTSEIIVTISEILDDKTLLISEIIKEDDVLDGEIFVYGQEVDDFNNLDKSAIFTITASALQQVDKELQETKQTIREQNERINILEQQISEINDRLRL